MENLWQNMINMENLWKNCGKRVENHGRTRIICMENLWKNGGKIAETMCFNRGRT
jgi:hypothetical protein